MYVYDIGRKIMNKKLSIIAMIILTFTYVNAMVRGKFRKDEDILLTDAIRALGEANWVGVAARVPGRTPRQCRDRWQNYLNRMTTVSAWTEDENQQLIAAVAAYGQKWTTLTRFFPGRPGNSIKNHYNFLMKNFAEMGNPVAALGREDKPSLTEFNRCTGLVWQDRRFPSDD
jgi:hypothetical protein